MHLQKALRLEREIGSPLSFAHLLREIHQRASELYLSQDTSVRHRIGLTHHRNSLGGRLKDDWIDVHARARVIQYIKLVLLQSECTHLLFFIVQIEFVVFIIIVGEDVSGVY